MTKSQELYQKLIHYDFINYIDPFEDLGTFDRVSHSFKEEVSDLVNPYTNQAYLPQWQETISEMRKIYCAYQKALHEENLDDERAEVTHYYLTSDEDKAAFKHKVTTYLSLGFTFPQVAQKVGRASASLRENFKRNEVIAFNRPCFFAKDDLAEGFVSPKDQLPLNWN
ncbi:hypothetical protein [Streptococcus sobrinus]|uniref:hypothetical protein n=1 Tax=Streptococcus sobrinus TaxID=1310 RepID=UPI0002E600F0|nr:hypothetical protein [Streptococcus sobrinus]